MLRWGGGGGGRKGTFTGTLVKTKRATCTCITTPSNQYYASLIPRLLWGYKSRELHIQHKILRSGLRLSPEDKY